MPTDETIRVALHREKNFDRVSTLIEKNGKYLINALALREGCSKTEVIRRAVLDRAGLRFMPSSIDLEDLQEVDDKQSADYSILRLQAHESKKEVVNYVIDKLSPEPAPAVYSISTDYDMRQLAKKLAESQEPTAALTEYEMGILRRAMANIQNIENPKNL